MWSLFMQIPVTLIFGPLRLKSTSYNPPDLIFRRGALLESAYALAMPSSITHNWTRNLVKILFGDYISHNFAFPIGDP